ncbi:putative phosphoribosyl transferase Rv0571c [Microbulbifer sp. NBRC 101763]|uniref:dienelactone hydrolase family protein n=1 Tax=unclassified Microbulbifer TaxID=2619833 RepID=UPI0024ADA4B2|nr:alpha/beta fold hydrolase [Microbulbifer sp. MLAF003]WHI51184.1 alpha/beta fold hydrolase [Microbulbifer sp. MLAF003]
MQSQAIALATEDITLNASLTLPQGARALIVFAHGSGSNRASPRNLTVASRLNDAGFATLLFDLLSVEESRADASTCEYRFDIDLSARRLVEVLDWSAHEESTEHLRVGLFGASTGAAVALVAAAERPSLVGAVVSRGGRPDLAGSDLPLVKAPTLLLVGGDDKQVLEMNKEALTHMVNGPRLQIIPHAGHLFEEPGAMDEVVHLTSRWFRTNLL